ncbi:MAG: shikimate dehydrogenase [Pseudomonadota bacterium]
MRKVGVVGWPVTQSRSPVIFGHWFERYGVEGRYELIPVRPEDADDFFQNLPAEWTGVNVTIPHKEAAARHVQCHGPALTLGVANTLWRQGGAVHGTSSDGHGFVASLKADAPAWDPSMLNLVVGAGGASAAIVAALKSFGEVMVVNRTTSRAEALAEKIGGVQWASWDALGDVLGKAGLLVNATSLGMTGTAPLELDVSRLPKNAVVADIVYNPLETPLLAAARAQNLFTVDGLGMLLHQATVGFERWFGIAPDVDAELRAKVVATL